MTDELVPSTASQYFGDRVTEYDSLIRRCVPRYDEMIERLVRYLPDGVERILELGCGTGNLTIALCRRFPDATITTLDAAPEMVELARARLQYEVPRSAARASVELARFEELAPEPGSVDLVTSCISLHHVLDKAELYRRVRAALRPGGTFRFADQLRGGTDANHAVNWAGWLAFCREPGGCSEEEIASLLEHAAAHDHYTPLAEHFRLLSRAGFRDPDCVWRHWIWGVVTAEA